MCALASNKKWIWNSINYKGTYWRNEVQWHTQRQEFEISAIFIYFRQLVCAARQHGAMTETIILAVLAGCVLFRLIWLADHHGGGESECDLIPYLTHSQNPRTSNWDPLTVHYMQGIWQRIFLLLKKWNLQPRGSHLVLKNKKWEDLLHFCVFSCHHRGGWGKGFSVAPLNPTYSLAWLHTDFSRQWHQL